MAECHPVGFRFVMEARERGAKIIHVDPRFTRTSANADLYAPIRPGTDIAFLGGLIHYCPGKRAVLQRVCVELYQRLHHHQRAVPGYGRPGWPFLRLRPEERSVRPCKLEL